MTQIMVAAVCDVTSRVEHTKFQGTLFLLDSVQIALLLCYISTVVND